MGEKVKAVLDRLRERLDLLYGERLVRMILYGSQARGDAEDGADIDVLVVLRGPVCPADEISRTIDDVADLSLQNAVVISCIFMDEESFTHRNGPLLRNIRREGFAL